MKCSSQRNCNGGDHQPGRGGVRRASMKCSSQRNCNGMKVYAKNAVTGGLNEVQFPKELQPYVVDDDGSARKVPQ